ncbi:TPA: DUF1329 domain-containing protein [Pseudomonas aeruginosa]
MFIRQALVCALTALSISAQAAATDDQVSKLGKELTPLGAERAGNADGTIPSWDGGITAAPAGYGKTGDHHIDPYASDKPLFTITRENVEQYKDKLSAGQLGLINSYPATYKIPVYPSRRSGSAPDWVYENTIKNAKAAKLVEEGNGFKDAFAGIPFPIPQNGLEAIWNHIARYRGTYVNRNAVGALVQANGNYALTKYKQEAKFKYYDRASSYDQLNNILFYFWSTSLAPARFAGEASIAHETLNQVKEPRKAWSYSPGQRRVRRAPALAYDTPTSGSDGIQTIDSIDMYNGSPDRYEWKLVGKKEMFIPYNSYSLTAAGVKYDYVLKQGHISSDLTRFELHRVWVVEATLKSSARHIYGKRVFFLDEDSWQAVEIDQYDTRGELWTVSVAYTKNFYDLPAVWAGIEAYYDIQSRRYFIANLDSEEKSTAQFDVSIPEDSYFEPANLRRKGVR